MNTIKALIATLIIGSSTAAMAHPAVSVVARASFGWNAPVVRDHRAPTTQYTTQYTRYEEPTRATVDNCQTNSLSGVYSSTYGRVALTQQGNRVIGFYPEHNGRIEGVIVGNQIRFQWQQPDGQGSGVWYLDGNGALMGSFGNGRSASNGGAWNLRTIG